MFGSRNVILRGLFQVQKMSFSSAKDLNSRIARVTSKVKQKQTVADVKKLQGFLEQTKVNKNFNQTLSRTAKYDQEFNEFLSQYKEKNPENANIIDMSHYSLDQEVAKTQKMR